MHKPLATSVNTSPLNSIALFSFCTSLMELIPNQKTNLATR
jgi:hypothetical protein